MPRAPARSDVPADRPRDLPLADVVRLQQAACDRAGSVVYARILEAVAADVEADGPCADLLEPWAANALADAVPLRLLGAVHRIVLAGRAPELAAYYPSAGGVDEGDPVPAFRAVVAWHFDELEDGMRHGVQTNEVGRACALFGGFHHVARSTGLPLRLLEVGASAGLLLRWDHYGYIVGGRNLGGDAALRFHEPWSGAVPAVADDLRVAERIGCDVNPVDPSSVEGARTLRGFLWPDQRHRRARLDAALEIAARVPATVEQADAADWVDDRLAAPAPRMATVIYHSIVLQYLPRETFRRMRETLDEAGHRATHDAPLFWLRMEPAGEVADIGLRSWPGGNDRVLGTTDYHGPPVAWTS
ncbi:MAG: DUF2332 domain-containing protein [Acidimicrobiales bacterium]|nr:DUF2332 domain-containing protein [Acidimicrobiales bacterium]